MQPLFICIIALYRLVQWLDSQYPANTICQDINMICDSNSIFFRLTPSQLNLVVAGGKLSLYKKNYSCLLIEFKISSDGKYFFAHVRH